ncbi:MAG: hypothetical protein CME78_11350 [Halomonas sp.]|nr:hypothetical protein [Halomonas sp.]
MHKTAELFGEVAPLAWCWGRVDIAFLSGGMHRQRMRGAEAESHARQAGQAEKIRKEEQARQEAERQRGRQAADG